VDSPLKEAFTALADALAKRPAEEILFDWFRSGRLVGELSVLIKRRHPDVQARIDRLYQDHLAQLGKRRRDPATKAIDYFRRIFLCGKWLRQLSPATLAAWWKHQRIRVA
jgi:hypothetical protein